jgi:acetyl-CoA C-acetyltransferase
MALHAIKAGEADVVISAGVETVSRFVKGNSDLIPGRSCTTRASPTRRPAARSGVGVRRLDRPREDGQLPDIYIAMGETAENVALLRTSAARDGRVRRALAEPGGEGHRQRLLRARDHADHHAGGTVVSTDDGPRPAPRWRRCPA